MAMGKLLSVGFPYLGVITTGLSVPTKAAIATLARALEALRLAVVDAVNFNTIESVSQAAQPTVLSGRIVVWEDSDATSGNSTHYIVANMDGTTVTFASEETVP